MKQLPEASAAQAEGSKSLSLADKHDCVMEAETKAEKAQREKRQLDVYLDQTPKRLETKAPAIDGQRADHQRTPELPAALSARLEAAMTEGSRLRVDLQAAQEEEPEGDDAERCAAAGASAGRRAGGPRGPQRVQGRRPAASHL